MNPTYSTLRRVFPTLTILLCLVCLPGAVLAHHCKGGHAGLPGCEGGGGGGGGVDTSALSLSCSFADAPGDSLRSDGVGAYDDGIDKVRCGTGDSLDTHSTSHLRFKSVAQGNVRNAVRRVDIAIDDSTCSIASGCAFAPVGVFDSAVSFDDMEDASIGVRAYAGTDGLDLPHIQNLTPDQFYEVSMDFNLEGTAERWVFQMMGRELPADFKDGKNCNLTNPADAISEDVTLYVWPDFNSDGNPDGFTVTTASSLDTSVFPPEVSVPDTRLATLCSNVDENGNGCGGPGSSDLCHLISKMEVQFTLHAENP